MMLNKRMRYLDLQIIWTGLSISFWSSLLIPSLTLELSNTRGDKMLSNNDKTSKALFAMSCFGVGEILGSTVMGKNIDRFGPQKGTI